MRVFILLIFWLQGGWTMAEAISSTRSGNVSFWGVIEGSSDKIDSVSFLVRDRYTYDLADSTSRFFYVRPDNEGNFNVKVGGIGGACAKLSQLVIFSSGENFVLSDFVIEPNDSIGMILSVNKHLLTIDFSGVGSSKYVCRRKIQEAYEDLLNRRNDSLTQSKIKYSESELQDSMDFYNRLQRSLVSILDSSKDWLKPTVYEIMYADVRSRLSLLYLDAHIYPYWHTGRELDGIINVFNRNRIKETKVVSDYAASLSFSYVEYLLLKEKTELFYKLEGKRYSFEDLYQIIKTKYKGEIRERLILIWLTCPIYHDSEVLNDDEKSFSRCLQDAVSTVENPNLLPIITKFSSVYSSGSIAYNFTLPNSEGNLVKMDDFKGKVVLIDFWFTGCSGCINTARILKNEVEPELKQYADFAVVSISVDKRKDTWIASINNGQYTSKSHVNLFTDGLGGNHDIIKHYAIIGYPTCIIIDRDGKIFARLSTEPKGEDVVILMKKALGKI